MNDAELTGAPGLGWRVRLPYLAILLCVVVAGWLTWSWLL
jgi:hypothetical protein